MPHEDNTEIIICPFCDSDNITRRGYEMTCHDLCLDCGAKSLVYRDEWVHPDEYSESQQWAQLPNSKVNYYR